jgi:hypothetical protein
MTYLYNKNVNVQNNNVAVSTTNPFPVTTTGSSTVKLDLGATGTSAFGELSTIQITPFVQLDAIYGLNVFDFVTSNTGTGSLANTDSTSTLFKVQSGTSSTGYGKISSRKFLRYRPGQGAMCRFTAAFTSGVAQSTQQAGFTDTESAICVGYDGTDFGIVRTTGGRTSIYKLTITTAPTGTQTSTVTLDGVAKTVTLNSGTSTNAAVQIFVDGVGGYPGWMVEQVANTVIFRNIDTKTTPGTFSFSSGGNATGAFSVIQAGFAQTEYWTKQADFSVDTLDGSGNAMNPSHMHLHPDKLNVYQISFRWLGVGMITFGIEDELTGKFMVFHQIHYTNQYNFPHVENPSFNIGYLARNRGGTTNLTLTGASMMMGIEGMINVTRSTKSDSYSISSAAKDVITHVVSYRNSYTYANKLNALSLNFKKLSYAFQSTDPVEIFLFQNPTPSTTLAFVDLAGSCATVSTTAATFDPAINPPIGIFSVGVNGESSLTITDLLLSEPPGSVISFAVRSTSSIARTLIAAIWTED